MGVRSWVLLSLMLLMSVPLIGQAEVSGEIVEFGYYRVNEEPARKRNLATTSGYSREGGNVVLVSSSDRIPIEKGRLFGLKFRIKGLQDATSQQLHFVVSHPEMIRPNGSTSNGYNYPVLLSVESGIIESHLGYSLDKEFEMVEGEWRFEIYYNKKAIISQTFYTFRSEMAAQ